MAGGGTSRGSGYDRRPPVAGETALRSRGVPAPDVKTELRRARGGGPSAGAPCPAGVLSAAPRAAWTAPPGAAPTASPVTWARGWSRRGHRFGLLVAACGLAGC